MLGNIAFQNFKKIWMSSKIAVERNLKVFEAQVISIILYNSSCWATAAPAAVLEKLDICNRKHLHRYLRSFEHLVATRYDLMIHCTRGVIPNT
jgi:hypothetical protein